MGDKEEVGVSFGRGRGRSTTQNGSRDRSSSDTSEKRSVHSNNNGASNGNGHNGHNGSNGNGHNGSSNGHGLKRENFRELPAPVYSTKPAGTNTKQGTSGKKVELCANYFRLIKKPSFEFNLYRVDFEPPLTRTSCAKRSSASSAQFSAVT